MTTRCPAFAVLALTTIASVFPAPAAAGGGSTALANDVIADDSLSATGAVADFEIDVPGGRTILWVRLYAEPTTSDFDLFVRRGAPASRAVHDWRSNSAAADEAVKVIAPAAGRYHVRVESYRGAGAFSLVARHATIDAPSTWVAGADTTPYWAYDDARRVGAISASRAGHMNTVFVDGKISDGRVAWSSSAYPMAWSWPTGESPVERVVRDAGSGGERLAVAVRFATFHDPHAAANVVPAARIPGTSWLDPACPAARRHVVDEVLDLLARTDVDEVNLDFVRYPASSQVSATAALPCTGGTWANPATSKTMAVARAVGEIVAAVKTRYPAVTVSGDLFGYSCYAPVESVGHDAFLLARSLDVVMPMLYPTSFAGAAGADPYGTVRRATAACVEQAVSREKVKPWVQAFDADGYDYNTAAKVATQIDAVRDAGGSGAVAWWFVSMGTSSATWAPLASHMPEDWTQRPHRDDAIGPHAFPFDRPRPAL